MNLENHEYEMALLGCVLLDNRVLEECKLSTVLFDNPMCRRVFDGIEALKAQRMTVDIVTLGNAMRSDVGFIANLTSAVPSAANARFYFEQLSEFARLRGLSRLAREIGELVLETSSEEVFARVDKSLSEIADTREIGYRPLASVMIETLAMIKTAHDSKGTLLGVATGFPGLDEKTNGWQKQEMIIIGARPGAGKTSIALNMASAAVRAGHKVGFFSAEMSSASLGKRLIADWCSVEFKRINSGVMAARDFEQIMTKGKELSSSALFLNDQPSISLRDLVSDARKMKRREGVGIVFIDYLSLISNERRDVPRHEQVAEISKTLKTLSRELDIPVVVLSQLTREAQGERPKLSQLRDSGAVEQDADMVILLHNMGWTDDTKQNIKINLIVEKNRNGATGDIPMIFRPAMMRFGEVQEAWEREQKRKPKA